MSTRGMVTVYEDPACITNVMNLYVHDVEDGWSVLDLIVAAMGNRRHVVNGINPQNEDTAWNTMGRVAVAIAAAFHQAYEDYPGGVYMKKCSDNNVDWFFEVFPEKELRLPGDESRIRIDIYRSGQPEPVRKVYL